MGLAVQAPADPLLAVVDVPAGDAATGASPLAEGMFATLLAGILDGQVPAADEGAIAGPELPLRAGEPGDQDPDDPALALLASMASPQPVLAVPAVLPETGPATSQDAPPAALVPAQGPASGPPPALDASPGATSEPALPPPEGPQTAAPPPTEAAPAGAPTPAEAGPGLVVAAPVLIEGQSPIPAPGTAALPQSPGSEAASEPAATIGQGPEPPAEPLGPGQSDAPGPVHGEAAPAPGGVVRSVGNASESAPGRGGDHPGRKPDDARPLPRASANGIAHAAPNSAVGELRQPPGADAPAVQPQDAPAPADALIDLPPQVGQVATAVIERVEAGGGEARIHLEPLELGEVVIHVRTDGDEVRIDVRAERPDAARLLRDHTQDLSSLLGSRGLNLSDVNVGVGGGNAGSPFESRRHQPRPVAGDFAAVLGLDDVPSSAGLHNRLRAAYNPDGALLYRV